MAKKYNTLTWCRIIFSVARGMSWDPHKANFHAVVGQCLKFYAINFGCLIYPTKFYRALWRAVPITRVRGSIAMAIGAGGFAGIAGAVFFF